MATTQPVTSSFTFESVYSVRAVNFEGKTIYLRKKQKKIIQVFFSCSLIRQQIENLLDIPVHKMMDELSSATIARIQQTNEPEISNSNTTHDSVEDTLWVDRYRPQKFTELLGNDRVARETMSWVKQWDWCVFGKNIGKKRPRDAEDMDEPDEYRRPREKVLLLSGPPGLGKTTLAHVVAQQAGYQVMEINASDARSGQIVDDRIQPALESGAAVGSTKPVLVIIDEIDGATGGGDNSASFVHKLIQLIQDKPRKKQHRGQKRDLHVKRPILRPIICICNDANASSLARLKPIAYHVRFSRPADIHIVKRLREICAIESLKAETRALSALVGIAKGDLRGCLNTLQFIKTRKEEVTEVIIRKATAGMKEAETSVLTILNNLFSPMTKKRVKELGMNEEEEGRYVARLSHEVDGSGRENSIATGCFAHYATLKRHDATFTRYEKAMEWLMTFDRFSASMYTDGDFALIPYIPYTLVPFHPLFQERGNPRVERDHTDWEQLQIARSNEEIYKTLSHCLRAAAVHQNGDYRHFATYPILQLEFTPYINRIISLPLRPVNSQIIRPEEKAVLNRLVDIMAALGLRFIQERAEDGQLSYRIDPAIDVFITYDGKRAADILVSRYAVRHLVAQEIDARITTREVEFVEKGKHPRGAAANPFPSVSTKGTIVEGTERPQKRAKSEKIDIADRPPTDFFGRPIARSIKPMSKSSKASSTYKNTNTETKFRVAFKYVEGNSAAVRKPIKVLTFL
ncbi:P-loop containing nucleoside triphosphate hydrolase protein [Cyathus striatus]|nr:P-loop containing nucleoside triphosphate hydrolase protein [Cyathus striatus]